MAGKRAGTTMTNGYRHINIDNQSYLAHRLAWFWMNDKFPDGPLDHINQSKADNRIANLREATQVQNGGNSKARKSRSGLKGAHWHEGAKRWSGDIHVRGRKIYLGLFDTAEQAHAAYCEAAKEMFGEFAYPRSTEVLTVA